MTTLLSELVRALSESAARELRGRSDGSPLTRAEMSALATLNDMAAAALAIGPVPERLSAATDLASLEELTGFDMKIVERAKARRAT